MPIPDLTVNYSEYGNSISVIPSIGVKTINAFKDDDNLPVTLEIQATSNVSIAASNDVLLEFNGAFRLQDSDSAITAPFLCNSQCSRFRCSNERTLSE